MTVQCCKCKKVHEEGEWTENPPAKGAHITHTYCPVCAEACYMELFSEQASRTTWKTAHIVSQLMNSLERPA
ncbi:MAG: hypothetical protein IT364_21660 [Candidatus Hydrogenedentes bacterium]|nr:hypothetical protein [Candidatus Hydrogenedentota bacterium]